MANPTVLFSKLEDMGEVTEDGATLTSSGEGQALTGEDDVWDGATAAPIKSLPNGLSTGASTNWLSFCSSLLLLCCLLCAMIIMGVSMARGSSRTISVEDTPRQSTAPLPVLPVAPGRTLVVMVHFASNERYSSSLVYFIHKAVRCWQDADYRVIIQRSDANSLNRSDPVDEAKWRDGLPPLPPNARYVLHQNECLDWGTVGWLLRLPPTHPDAVDTSLYRYFIILNTSVKGPFLPYYLEAAMDRDAVVQCSSEANITSAALTSNMSAAPVLWQASGWLNDSHPIAITEDYSEWTAIGGLRAFDETGNAFGCFSAYWSVVTNSEVGASQAILGAGYNIAALQRGYWSKDFRAADACKNVPSNNPTIGGALVLGPDGTNLGIQPLNPLEVVFVKHKTQAGSGDAARDALLKTEETDTFLRKQQSDFSDPPRFTHVPIHR